MKLRAEEEAAKKKEADKLEADQISAISNAVMTLDSKNLATIVAALTKAVQLGVPRASPAFRAVVEYITIEELVQSAIRSYNQNNLKACRLHVNELVQLGVVLTSASLQPVSLWIEQEDGIATSQSFMTDGNIPKTRDSLNIVKQLGVPSSDSRILKIQNWLGNEFAKEESIAASMLAKTSGDVDASRKFYEKALQLGSLSKEPRLSAVSNWLFQEDAISSATKAMNGKNLNDAKKGYNEAIRLGVLNADRRAVVIKAYIEKEDAIETSILAARSAVSANDFTLAKAKYEFAMSLGAPSSDSRLIEVNKWLESESLKSVSIEEAIAFLSRDPPPILKEAQSLLSGLVGKNISPFDFRLVSLNYNIFMMKSTSEILVSDYGGLSASIEFAEKCGIQSSDPTLIYSRQKLLLFHQAIAIQKCNQTVDNLDKTNSESCLNEAIELGIPSTDFRLAPVVSYIHNTFAGLAEDLSGIDPNNALVGDAVRQSNEILRTIAKKPASKHLLAASSSVLLASRVLQKIVALPEIDIVSVSEHSEMSSSMPSLTSISSLVLLLKELTNVLKSLLSSIESWKKKTMILSLIYGTGMPRPCDVSLHICIDRLLNSVKSVSKAVAHREKHLVVARAMDAIVNNHLDIVKKSLFDAIVLGFSFSDSRLIPLKAWIIEASETLSFLISWMSNNVKGLLKGNAEICAMRLLSNSVTNIDKMARMIEYNPDFLLEIGVRETDAEDIRVALIRLNLISSRKSLIIDKNESRFVPLLSPTSFAGRLMSDISPPVPSPHSKFGLSVAAEVGRIGLGFIIVAGEEIPIVGSLLALASQVLSIIDNMSESDSIMKDVQQVVARVETTVRRYQGREVDSSVYDNLSQLQEVFGSVHVHVINWCKKNNVGKFFAANKFKGKFKEDMIQLKSIIETLQLAVTTDSNLIVREIGDGVGELKDIVKEIAKGNVKKNSRSQASALIKMSATNLEISSDSYTFLPGDAVGIGSTAKIYLLTMDGEIRCAKVFDLSTFNTAERIHVFETFNKELATICSCRHNSIVNVWGATTTHPNKLIMIMDYHQRGSLRNFLNTGYSTLDATSKLNILRGICNGMAYLYGKSPPIQHRDLKSLNILIDENGRPKIIDFGISDSDNAYKSTATYATKTLKSSFAGTPHWSAPEVLDDVFFSEKSDVYSFAIVMWEVLTGEYPWVGVKVFNIARLVVDQDRRPVIPADIDPNLSQLITRMWDKDIEIRPTFSEISQILQQIVL